MSEGDLLQATHDAVERIEAAIVPMVERHELDLYGIPGDCEKPGLCGRVGSLEQSRRSLRKGLYAAWALLLAALGVLFGKWWT